MWTFDVDTTKQKHSGCRERAGVGCRHDKAETFWLSRARHSATVVRAGAGTSAACEKRLRPSRSRLRRVGDDDRHTQPARPRLRGRHRPTRVKNSRATPWNETARKVGMQPANSRNQNGLVGSDVSGRSPTFRPGHAMESRAIFLAPIGCCRPRPLFFLSFFFSGENERPPQTFCPIR